MRQFPWRIVSILAVVAAILLPAAAMAAPPVVKTVPWVATNPLIAHDTYPGKAVTLKGTSDVQGANFTYRWEFGDGSPNATGTVTNMWAIEASHTYAGTVGDIFAATLTVTNTTTAESGSATYLVKMQSKSLEVEANVAIDEGLWYLHKNFYRYVNGGKDYGTWMASCGGGVCAGYIALQAANATAFFVNGHRVDGLPSNPYTDTVQRAMRRFFDSISSGAAPSQTYTAGTYGAALGTIESDCSDCTPADPSSNGLFLYIGNDTYQMGMVVTAVAASGTPAWVTDTGGANVRRPHVPRHPPGPGGLVRVRAGGARRLLGVRRVALRRAGTAARTIPRPSGAPSRCSAPKGSARASTTGSTAMEPTPASRSRRSSGRRTRTGCGRPSSSSAPAACTARSGTAPRATTRGGTGR